jgi:metal-responsive CopG/Arc/MetJ family transcriptional regulator
MGNTDKPIINLVVDTELLEQVDEFWHEKRFASRSEAIRWLIRAALDKKLTPNRNDSSRPKKGER